MQASASLNIFPSDRLQFRVTSNYTNAHLETLQSNNNIFGVTSMAQSGRPEWVAYNNDAGSSGFATLNKTMQMALEQEVHRLVTAFGANYRPHEVLALDAPQ